ncbi:hypothetical protein, partial [Enterococcus faecium]|uniref:hypothetical protein n=1 Tax=Enterococcus faecium TaxID=1352 RepID=UPI003F4378D4
TRKKSEPSKPVKKLARKPPEEPKQIKTLKRKPKPKVEPKIILPPKFTGKIAKKTKSRVAGCVNILLENAPADRNFVKINTSVIPEG